jgi:hypothetical protein
MQQDVAYNLHEAIRRRAEEIYERNGKIPGRDVKNRMRAEEEIKSEAAGDAERRTAVIVKVNGIDQAGEYAHAAAQGYAPAEFSAGDAVAVRFEEQDVGETPEREGTRNKHREDLSLSRRAGGCVRFQQSQRSLRDL